MPQITLPKIGALASYKWDEGEEAGAFNGLGEFTLVLGTDARMAISNNLGVRVQELTKLLRILIIDLFNIVVAKMADFHKLKIKMEYLQD